MRNGGLAALDPTVVVADTHALIASSLAVALGQAGFTRVVTVDTDALFGDREPPPVDPAPGDIVLFDDLTEREADVLAALVDGAAPKQIAHLKGITVSAVRGHIQRVLAKLDVSSQREALAMARHAGWP